MLWHNDSRVAAASGAQRAAARKFALAVAQHESAVLRYDACMFASRSVCAWNDESRLDLSGCTRTGSKGRFRGWLALGFYTNHLIRLYRAHIVDKMVVSVYRDVARDGVAGFRCFSQLIFAYRGRPKREYAMYADFRYVEFQARLSDNSLHVRLGNERSGFP